MSLPEVLCQPGQWQAHPLGRLGPAGPSFNSGLHQTSPSPCLPWEELWMLPSTETTQTSLCSGWENFLLVHFNNAEGRMTLQGPWVLRAAVGCQGEQWNSSSEGVLVPSEFLQWARQGARRGLRAGSSVRRGGWRSQQGHRLPQADQQILHARTMVTTALQQPQQEGSVFPVKAVWGSPLHHSLGVSSCLPLTTGSSKLPATTPETSCCKKDSRSEFIHCPCCKLNSALHKSLKFVICHKPCHQTSSISAEVVEIKQGLEGFG